MEYRNHRTDFDIAETFFRPGQGGERTQVAVPSHVVIEYRTAKGGPAFRAERNGDACTNCTLSQDGYILTVHLALHNRPIGCGRLLRTVTEIAADPAFPSGERHTVTPGATEVILYRGDNGDIDTTVRDASVIYDGIVIVLDPSGHTHPNLPVLDCFGESNGVPTYRGIPLATDPEAAGRYLSRIAADTAAGKITFQQGLESLAAALFGSTLTVQGQAFLRAGIQLGQYTSSLYTGTGAAIDAGGNAEVESLKVRSYMEVLELIVNRLSAIEGDQLLTESDMIESVEDLGGGEYRLHLKSKWEGYFTAQAEGNILKGVLNTLSSGHGETSPGSGEYYTSWMLVRSVNAAANTITVGLYDGEDVPGGTNYPPTAMMRVARWGNAVDPARQSCIYLSSTEGRIVKRAHVTAPMTGRGNDGVVIGEAPDWLKNLDLPILDGDEIIYAKTIVYQQQIQLDHQGNPTPTYVDRGEWTADPSEPYHCESINSLTGVYETSDVWHLGCKWRCISDDPSGEPVYNSMEWFCIEGNPEFILELESTRGDYLPLSDFNTSLVMRAKLYNQDVTSEVDTADISWTRYSEDASGNPRTASDNIWALAHAQYGTTCPITFNDIDYDGQALPRLLRFTVTAVLRDGRSNTATWIYST